MLLERMNASCERVGSRWARAVAKLGDVDPWDESTGLSPLAWACQKSLDRTVQAKALAQSLGPFLCRGSCGLFALGR